MTKESLLHIHIVELLQMQLHPEICMTTFPAGGGGRVRGAMLKRAGLRPGWPDIQMIGHGRYYGLELKTPKGRLSEAQKDLHQRLTACGAKVAIIRSLEEAQNCIEEWGLTKRRYQPLRCDDDH